MKHIFCLMALWTMAVYGAEAQYLRGVYGNFQPATQTTMNTYNGAGVAKATAKDTLVNTDTGYVWVYQPVRYDMAFDLLSTVLSGTVSSASVVLQGCNDSSGVNANWVTLTGVTTTCAACVGASSTTAPVSGGTHYIWQLPAGLGDNWRYYRVRVIQGGTCTAVYSGVVTQKW